MRTRTPGQRWFDSPDDFERRCEEWRWLQWETPHSTSFWLPPSRALRESSIEQMRREFRNAIEAMYSAPIRR